MVSWRRHWFLVGLALVSVGAFAFPEGGTALRGTGWALPLLTATSLFLSGITLETAGLREGADVRGIALGLSSTYVVAPVLAIVFVRLWGPANDGAGSEGYFFFEAMMIVAAQASTIASAPALTLVAGGNQALALAITLSSNLMTARKPSLGPGTWLSRAALCIAGTTPGKSLAASSACWLGRK